MIIKTKKTISEVGGIVSRHTNAYRVTEIEKNVFSIQFHGIDQVTAQYIQKEFEK